MKPPMKLNSIDQEHLQELYNSAGVARDELPYSEAFDTLVQGFQDRTFKNADHEQVYAAMIKYVRSSSNASTQLPEGTLSEDQLKFLKPVLSRYAVAGKIMPYSDEFVAAHKEFNKQAKAELTEQDFWRTLMRLQGAKRRPPTRKKVVAAVEEPDDDDGE